MDAKEKGVSDQHVPINWIGHPAEGKVWIRTKAENKLEVASYEEAVKKGANYIEIGKANNDYDIFVRICGDECKFLMERAGFGKLCKTVYDFAKHQGAFFLLRGKVGSIDIAEIRPIGKDMPAVEVPWVLTPKNQEEGQTAEATDC